MRSTNYYTHLLANPQAMHEFCAKVAARQDLEEAHNLHVDVVQQNVTFIGCHFAGNAYGDRSDSINCGAIGVETDDNDCMVAGCLFTGNQFGDNMNIVVYTDTFVGNVCNTAAGFSLQSAYKILLFLLLFAIVN